MHYKVEFEVNWTTPLGYVFLDDEEYNSCLEKLEKHKDKTFDFSYCADGDDYYVDFDKTGNELIELFEKAIEVPDEDYKIIEKYDLDGSTGSASDIYDRLLDNFDELDGEE